MSTKLIACWVILCAALLFKFWLIAEMEITDDTDDPAHYLEQILQHKGLCYGPGAGDVGKVFYDAGIPFRLGIEVGFLVAALLCVRAMLEWPTQSFVSLGLYLFVIFNPAVEELLSHLMSDQVWLVETLIGLSLIVFFAGATTRLRWLSITLASVFLGLATVTRSTFVPLLATFLIWATGAIVLSRIKTGRFVIDRPLVGGGLLCLYGIVLFYYSVCLTNARYNDFLGLNAFDSREYQCFYMCLQSVGEPTGEPYFPVDDHRLKLIAQAGPRSKWFVDQLARDVVFRQVSLETYGKPGIALCWFHWAVFETINTDGDLKKTFGFFDDIEHEIAQAAEEKRLTVRPILPLPDCRLAVVGSALPQAFVHIASLTFQQPSRYAWAWNAKEPRFDDTEFTRALNRRPVTASPVREQMGRVLCTIYSVVYAPLVAALVVAVFAFVISFMRGWEAIPALPGRFLAQQLFLVAFVVLFGWYLLFDASGLLAVPRYLVYHNVMVPVLLVYYSRKTWQLMRRDFSAFSPGYSS